MPSSGCSAGQAISTAFAIAAAAFPAPTTRVLPFGGGGKWRGTISNGSAAVNAARKLASNNSRGSMNYFPPPPAARFLPAGGAIGGASSGAR